MTENIQNLQGNHACALAAVAAGCRFYAGYPITPSSEIAEKMAAELPKVGGIFVQMEDEIASMAAVIGASAGGAKALTATSGPGFSLKQENLGYAAGTEIPCVVVNVMRGGPSTGMPTRPAQGDIMQARWGTHGDHPIIVLTPWSVDEIYEQTIRAFNLSEVLRIPAVILIDECIGHLVETVDLGKYRQSKLEDRKWATDQPDGYLPYAMTDDGIPAMPRPGDGNRSHTTGLTHGENGFPTQNPEQVNQVMQRLLGKTRHHRDLLESVMQDQCADADVVIVAYGITARAAHQAVLLLRDEGIKAGLFRPITLWPFPEQAFRETINNSHLILAPEMNAGQLINELERFIPASIKIAALNRFDGEPITPLEIRNRIKELLSDD